MRNSKRAIEVHSDLPDQFCWSKMGIDAGEILSGIIARKEIERRANGGVFLWGVGNSVMPALADLFQIERAPQVMFSEMKCRAKELDRNPRSVVLWLSAENPDGRRVDLPKYSLVTSRGNFAGGGNKRSHYALICEAESPLHIAFEAGVEVLGSSVVNLRTGKPLGASQVTAVVRKARAAQHAHLRSAYPVSFSATLRNPGQIRLLNPVILESEVARRIDDIVRAGSIKAWKDFVLDVKEAARKRCEGQFRLVEQVSNG